MKLCDEKLPHFDPLKKISQRKGTRNKNFASVISCIYMKGTFPEKMNENNEVHQKWESAAFLKSPNGEKRKKLFKKIENVSLEKLTVVSEQNIHVLIYRWVSYCWNVKIVFWQKVVEVRKRVDFSVCMWGRD